MISNSSLILLVFLSIAVQTLGHETLGKIEEGAVGRRLLLSFRETPQGSNATFECSPSGPCLPCLYSEKNNKKYRCSETGFRIPLKCIEVKDNSKGTNGKSSHASRSTLENSDNNAKLHVLLHDAKELTTSMRHRILLDDPSTLENGQQAYITYRSCVPAVNEEKLSVLRFEGIVLCLLLISGSVIYFRRKRTVAFGGGRLQTNSRF